MDYSRRGVRSKQRELNSKGTKIKKMFGITFMKALLICTISFIILVGCLGIGMFKGILNTAPDISTLDVTPSGYATVIYDIEGHEMTKLVAADSNRTYVAMDKIPRYLANAFVAIEDERFYEHNGIDIKGIMRAGVIAVTSRSLSQGASTITQQLIKNNVFENWASEESTMEKVKRKVQEQFLALELEKVMSKDNILELYMNSINLGQNTLGVQAASLRYFNKPVYELNISEAACIAGITQNPSAMNPISHPEKNNERRLKVLGNMLKHGYISEEEYNEAVNDDVYSRIQTVNTQYADNSVYSYFVDEVIECAAKDLTAKMIAEGYTDSQASTMAYNLLYSGGLGIYTTQDPQVQALCDEVYSDESNYTPDVDWLLNYQLTIIKNDGTKQNFSSEMYKAFYKESNSNFNMLYDSQDDAYAAIAEYCNAVMEPGDEIESEHVTLTPQPQISFSIEDHKTGYVLALVGGRGQKETSRSLNRATNTTRQPGSTFKVVSSFAPALDSAGLTLATVFIDEPYKYSNGRPVNNWYGSGYKGTCSIRYAIEQSLNIITVKTLTYITPQLGFDYLQNFGFTTLIDRRVSADGSVHSDITQALALGGITDGVTNLELNASYATIANGGVYMEPILYTKIVDHDGNVLIDKSQTQETRRVLKESTAYLLTSAMVDVVTKGTGGKANFGGMAIAGKTGTTSDNKDAWFAGFTPYYTATSWVGYDNNVKMTEAEKGVCKTAWRKIMAALHEGLENPGFEVPQGVTTCVICSKSGKLPIAGLCDAHRKTEYFAEGTVPTEDCDVHYSGMVCLYSGKRACNNCPFKVPGTLEFRPANDPSSSGSTHSTASCPHDDMFFTTPTYLQTLVSQQQELAAMGYAFSLEGYY